MTNPLILMGLMSALLFAWVVGSEADEIGLRDLSILSVAFVAILALQILLMRILGTVLKRKAGASLEIVLLLLSAAILAANAYFLAFYTLEAPTITRAACAGLVGAAFFGIMVCPKYRPVFGLFAIFSILISIFSYTYTRLNLKRVDVSQEIASLPIKSERNVYLIGMESLQSPKAYRDNYGIHHPPHIKVLESAGFRVLDHAYSAAKSTLRSYATIFEFKRDFNATELGEREVFVSDNSTFRSFRDAKYSIQTLYKNNYFPVDTRSVDYKYPPPAFDACDELGRYFFYGFAPPGSLVPSTN